LLELIEAPWATGILATPERDEDISSIDALAHEAVDLVAGAECALVAMHYEAAPSEERLDDVSLLRPVARVANEEERILIHPSWCRRHAGCRERFHQLGAGFGAVRRSKL